MAKLFASKVYGCTEAVQESMADMAVLKNFMFDVMSDAKITQI